MMFAKSVVISTLILFTAGISCSADKKDIEPEHLTNIQSSFEFYSWLLKESDTFYDKEHGHWGQSLFGYRNMLNECFLRFDGYQLIQQTSFPEKNKISVFVDEMTAYYKQVADTIGTGVWGIPAEVNHPEMKNKIQYEISQGFSKNAWIYDLSGTMGSKAGMYYAHGQVFANISRSYLRNKDTSLLPYIINGAKWIVQKKYDYGNINYFAAAIKGLSYAYAVTDNIETKQQALVYLSVILGSQNTNGSFGAEHDQEAGYHGINVSCLAVARKYLPENELPANIDKQIEKSVDYLRELKDVATEDRAGFVVQAWYYISCLADDNILPKLSATDWKAYSEALQICIDKKEKIAGFKTNNNYIYQKEIQTACLIGSTVAKYYFKTASIYY